MLEVFRLTHEVFGHPVFGPEVPVLTVDAEGAPDGLHRRGAAAFVERDADFRIADLAEVQPLIDGGFQHGGLHRSDIDGDRVEEMLRLHGKSVLLQPFGEAHGLAVDALGDGFQPLRPVEDGVEPGHDGQKRLRGADVGGRLFAADMLLARLQREAIGPVPVAVDGDADDAARHGAFVVVLRRHIGGVRAAIADRHAEPLC